MKFVQYLLLRWRASSLRSQAERLAAQGRNITKLIAEKRKRADELDAKAKEIGKGRMDRR